jgi:hypothetical protein
MDEGLGLVPVVERGVLTGAVTLSLLFGLPATGKWGCRRVVAGWGTDRQVIIGLLKSDGHLEGSVPLLPACLIEPLWGEFADLIGAERQPEFSPNHPWGCHRRRVPDRVVFDHVIAALVHGSGYERIATSGCSDRTIRRRLLEWAQAGHGQTLLRLALAAFDQMIGLHLDDLSVDGSITKSPCGGEVSGRSPVDRGKQGTKRSCGRSRNSPGAAIS